MLGSLKCKTIHLKNPLPEGYNTWVEKTMYNLPLNNWAGTIFFSTSGVWSDGTNTYFSDTGNFGPGHFVLNGDTWEPKTWVNGEGVSGGNIWTDGENIYYSSGDIQLVLNGDTWGPKEWIGDSDVYGSGIWSDGTKIYYSNNGYHAILNGDTWTRDNSLSLNLPTFNGLPWSDGTNIFVSARENSGTSQYILDNNRWKIYNWNIPDFVVGNVWTDGANIYASSTKGHYVLNGNIWEPKTWVPETMDGIGFDYSDIWTDGTNIYCTTNITPYVLAPIPVGSEPEVEPKSFMAGWRMGQFIRGMRG